VRHNNGQRSIVICHSLGCNLFHYFLDWLELNFALTWLQWFFAPLPSVLFFVFVLFYKPAAFSKM